MSALEIAVRIVIGLARHPVVQREAKRALRNATAEVLRQVRRRSRAGVSGLHVS